MRKYLACLMIAVAFFSAATMKAQESKDDAVKKLFSEYVLAFNAGDVTAMERMWSDDAIYVDHQTGERTTGRETIVADLKAAFANNPDLKLSGKVTHLNFLSDDIVNVQGEVAVTSGDQPPVLYRYTSIAKRQDTGWRLHLVEEFPVSDSGASTASLQDLQWLIGTWRTEGKETAEVLSTVRAAVGGAFLVRSYESTAEDGSLQTTTEIIGVDPRTRSLLVWSFHSDGSFGSGVASKEGDQWQIKSIQTLADGRTASGTFVINHPDPNTFTMQLVAHEIEGEPQPSAQPVTLKRVISE